MTYIFAVLLCVAGLLIDPEMASALQEHPAPEGLYAHQFAHAFFIFSMAFLAYWLQQSRLVEKRSWRHIQISSLCFILWNINAMVGHEIGSRLGEDVFVGSVWSRMLVVERAVAPHLYYLVKMDHLICLPAIIFLFLGLRSLMLESEEKRG